jgi:hypothetical protein
MLLFKVIEYLSVIVNVVFQTTLQSFLCDCRVGFPLFPCSERIFLNVLRGQHMLVNIPPLLILCLLIGIRSLPLFMSRCKNPPPLTSHDLQLFRFAITFVSCFTMIEYLNVPMCREEFMYR